MESKLKEIDLILEGFGDSFKDIYNIIDSSYKSLCLCNKFEIYKKFKRGRFLICKNDEEIRFYLMISQRDGIRRSSDFAISEKMKLEDKDYFIDFLNGVLDKIFDLRITKILE